MVSTIKVTALNGNTFEFDADTWAAMGNCGVAIFKSGAMVAEFSAFLLVQKVVVPEVIDPPVEVPDPVEPDAPVVNPLEEESP